MNRFFTVLIALITVGSTSALQAQTERAFHVGLIYPISSNGLQSKDITNYCSMHAIAGLSKSEMGATFSGFANIIRDTAKGIQAAGFSNYVGRSAKGAQFAGFLNYVRYDFAGLQAAGFANVTGSAKGAQFSGFTNIVTDSADVQMSGFASIAKAAHVQGSGFVNVAGNVNGAQLAGFINVAKQVKGTQLAGFINVARKVKGTQIGFINIADSSDSPIGLINIVKNGERAIGITMDETGTGIIALRSGGRRLYGILGVGVNTRNIDERIDKLQKLLYALEAGFGLHVPIAKTLRLNIEGTALSLTDFEQGNYLRSSLRVLPAISLGSWEVFAGPSFNCVVLSDNKGAGFISEYAYTHRRYNNFTGLYFGALAGVQVRL